jgi:hypothetical protein
MRFITKLASKWMPANLHFINKAALAIAEDRRVG